ncbi:15-hydroxyprostaglandin dehydrogenase [Coniochaeta sp. 2T2.1]|nr:15-hydroxyprostaglandin dehydrogenase [Coniochaeta sp. 2T2.1]
MGSNTDMKVAIITGGASGIGLATALTLSRRQDWEVHIMDLNPPEASLIFHQVDVTDYSALGQTFKDIFQLHGRLDFVYANAGVVEQNDEFYQTSNEDPPPLPKSMSKVIDVCLTSAATTAYLAQHYLRKTPGEKSLIFTASCGALYPAYGAPIYTATKHGVLGLMRAMAPRLWRNDNVRVNAVLPGTVKTNLHTEENWKQFPEKYFTPVEKIVEAVLILLDGTEMGKAIECCGQNHYYREQYEYCDDTMRAVMSSTDVGN